MKKAPMKGKAMPPKGMPRAMKAGGKRGMGKSAAMKRFAAGKMEC